ncbi:MAG: formate/nitrite transporter family protein [Muribaculaceae bacterium]
MSVYSPTEVLKQTFAIGINKILCSNREYGRLAILSILAGAYIAIGGILSVIIGFGFPELTVNNPGLQRLLSGTMFPLGLILVVFLGAELFTGNNALLMPSLLDKKYKAWNVIKNWILVYFGNFVGAILFATLFVYMCGLTANEPYHQAVINIATAKVSMPWHVVLLKGIGANWFVCLAIWLGLSSSSAGARMLGCWFPVMAFVALGYEHSIANMFFIPIGMLEGANISIYQFIVSNLIPATIGNIIGGALFVGIVYWYINHKSVK